MHNTRHIYVVLGIAGYIYKYVLCFFIYIYYVREVCIQSIYTYIIQVSPTILVALETSTGWSKYVQVQHGVVQHSLENTFNNTI